MLFAGRVDEFLSYWHDEASYEAALPVPGLPAVVTGREALHATFTALVAGASRIWVEDRTFRQTLDPAIAYIEERMIGELPDGYRYENRLAIRVTFRDGRIAHVLEYYGQFAHADLLRHLGFGS